MGGTGEHSSSRQTSLSITLWVALRLSCVLDKKQKSGMFLPGVAREPLLIFGAQKQRVAPFRHLLKWCFFFLGTEAPGRDCFVQNTKSLHWQPLKKVESKLLYLRRKNSPPMCLSVSNLCCSIIWCLAFSKIYHFLHVVIKKAWFF